MLIPNAWEEAMREVVLYCLDRIGAVQSTERFLGTTGRELKALAEDRLCDHDAVEIWEGSVRLLAVSRSSSREVSDSTPSLDQILMNGTRLAPKTD